MNVKKAPWLLGLLESFGLLVLLFRLLGLLLRLYIRVIRFFRAIKSDYSL